MQINTNVLDLANIISDANVFATNATDNPRISGAALKRHDDLLLSIATDRFRFGISSAIVDYSASDEWCIWIPYDELKQLHAALKGFGTARKRADMPVTIHAGNDTVTIALPGQNLSFQAQPSDLPDWRGLFARTTPTTPTGSFNPGYLRDFGRITPRGKNDRATVTVGGATTPTRVEIGDYFMGLLMPLNPDDTRTLYEQLRGTNQ